MFAFCFLCVSSLYLKLVILSQKLWSLGVWDMESWLYFLPVTDTCPSWTSGRVTLTMEFDYELGFELANPGSADTNTTTIQFMQINQLKLSKPGTAKIQIGWKAQTEIQTDKLTFAITCFDKVTCNFWCNTTSKCLHYIWLYIQTLKQKSSGEKKNMVNWHTNYGRNLQP